MSLPQKPWDAAPSIQRTPTSTKFVPHSSSSIPSIRFPSGVNVLPPPLPPRQHVNASIQYSGGYPLSHSYSMYGGYGGGYGGLGGYSLSGYGYGSSYGMPYRGGYNGRSIDDSESRFFQLAEESSRPAFQSIDSIVRTFASVTMMLESTFHAMQTSFHAVLGVAENFDRLRKLSVQVAKYMSALAVIRTVYWFYRRILYMLGLIEHHPSTEIVWSTAEHSVTKSLENQASAGAIRSSWPIITFFGLLFGGPFVIFKLLSSFKGSSKDDQEKWDPRIHESEEVVMMYNFKAANESELTVTAGEILRVPTAKHIKENSGWISAVNKLNRIGLVPANYLSKSVQRKSSLPVEHNLVTVHNIGGPVDGNQKCEKFINSSKADAPPVIIDVPNSSVSEQKDNDTN